MILYFSKTIFFQSHESHSLQNEQKYKRICWIVHGKQPLSHVITQNMSYVYKKSVKSRQK